jgi:hypothetical protein
LLRHDKLKHIGHLNLLGENRGLAPSNGLGWRESVMVNDAEMSFSFIDHFSGRMTLKAK